MTSKKMDAPSNLATEHHSLDTSSLLEMSSEERLLQLDHLDQEIISLERALFGSLPPPPQSEQRNLKWILSWKSFDQLIEKNYEHHALKYQVENDALTSHALEKLYRSCGDHTTADSYLAKTASIINRYIRKVYDKSTSWQKSTPFQDGTLMALFQQQWLEVANEQ